MDKQQIRRQLELIAQEEIPDTMDIWEGIRGQLKRKGKPKEQGLMLRLANATTIFVLMILLGGMGFAAYYATLRENPSPMDGNVYYPVNLSQTVDGVTVTVNSAFADANQITIQYTTAYNSNEVNLPAPVLRLETADGLIAFPLEHEMPMMGGGGSDGSFYFSNIASFDTSRNETWYGQTIALRLFIQFGGDGSVFLADPFALTATAIVANATNMANVTATPIPLGTVPPNMPQPIQQNVDPFAITATALVQGATIAAEQGNPTVPPNGQNQGNIDPFAMTATAIINQATAMAAQFLPTVPPPDDMTATPIPFNGGNLEPSLIPPVQFTPTPVIPVRTFAFTLQLPFYNLESVTVEPTQGDFTTSLRIQNLRVAPTLSRFEVCYPAPDGDVWYPMIQIESDAPENTPLFSLMPIMGEDGNPDYGAYLGEAYWFNTELCVPVEAPVPYIDATNITIRVPYLYQEPNYGNPNFWQAEGLFFSLMGIDTEIDFGYQQGTGLAENEVTSSNGMLYRINSYPPSFTLDEAKQYIQNNWLRERLQGNWQFQVVNR